MAEETTDLEHLQARLAFVREQLIEYVVLHTASDYDTLVRLEVYLIECVIALKAKADEPSG